MSKRIDTNPLQNYENLPTLLASDEYWKPFADGNTDHLKRLHDHEAEAHKIASLANSLENIVSRTDLNTGDDLPRTEERQVLRLVEDSRYFEPRLSAAMALLRYVDRCTEQRHDEFLSESNPDYVRPTFGELARDIDDAQKIYLPRARDYTKHSLTKIAAIKRRVIYTIYNEETEGYIGLDGVDASFYPEDWNLIPIANLKVGTATAYNTWPKIKTLAKIVSAQLFEVNHIIDADKPPDKTPKPPRKRKSILLPQFYPSRLASNIQSLSF